MTTYRIEIKHENKGLAFGYDHALGEFLQIWKRPDDPEELRLIDTYGPDDEDMLVDEDVTTGFSKEKLIALLNEHGFSYNELEQEYLRRNPSY